MPSAVPSVRFRRVAAATIGVLLAIALALWIGGWRFHVHYAGQTDLGSYFLPKYDYAAERISAGELPLWNPYEFGGIPFLATNQPAVFYPPVRLAYAAASGVTAYELLLTLHLFIGALGGALLARDLGLGLWPSVFAGAWVTHPIWYARAYDHPVFSMPTSWIPLLVVLTRRLVREPSMRHAALLGIVAALQALAGYPPLVLATAYVLVLSIPFWLAECRLDARPIRTGRMTAAFAVAMVVALLLAAAQLLPTAHLTLLTNRAGDAADTRAQLAELSKANDDVRLMLAIPLSSFAAAWHAMWERSGPFLLVPGALALVLRPRSPATWFAFATLFLTAGLPAWAYSALPLYGFVRFGFEWFFIASIATYLLAAIGLDALLDRFATLGGRARAAVVLGVLAAGTWANFRALNPRWLELDLGPAPPIPDVSAACDLHDPLYRSFLVGGLVRGSSMSERIRTPAGYEQSLLPLRVARLQKQLGIGNGMILPAWARSVSENAPIASRYSLRCVVTARAPVLEQGGFTWTKTGVPYAEVYRNPDALPRVRLAHEILPAASPDEAMELVRTSPPRGVVLEATDERDTPVTCATSGDDRVDIVHDRPEDLLLRTRSDCAAWLVVSDTMLPGWTATLDDAPVRIANADYAFRAVLVPPGEHTVAFSYDAPGLLPGALLSFVGVFVTVVLLARGSGREAT